MPLMWQKERKEVEHIESKSRTRDDRLLVTILLVLQICELFGGIVPLMIEVWNLAHCKGMLYTYHILVTHVRYPTLATSYDHTTLSHDYTTLSHYHTTLSHDHLPHPHHTCNISHITWPHHSDTWPYHSVTWPHTRRLLLRLTHPRKNGVIF